MDGTREGFLAWCREQRAQAERAHDHYAAGRTRFFANNVDVSKEQMASLRRVIAEMDDLIMRVEGEGAV